MNLRTYRREGLVQASWESMRCVADTDQNGCEFRVVWNIRISVLGREAVLGLALRDFQCYCQEFGFNLVGGRCMSGNRYFENLLWSSLLGWWRQMVSGRWHCSQCTGLKWGRYRKMVRKRRHCGKLKGFACPYFWEVFSYLVCILPSFVIFNYWGKVRLRSSLWVKNHIFRVACLDWKSTGNALTGSCKWTETQGEVKTGVRNTTVISLELVFANGESQDLWDRE